MTVAGRLTNRIAIVTGAGDGIGAAVAQRFVAEGARVVAADISAEKLRQHQPRDTLAVVEQDVTASDAAQRLVQMATSRFGGLDIVVNNAGMSLFTPVEQLSDSEWNATFDVNVNAAFRLSRAAIPFLKKSKGGRLVHVSSIHTLRSRVGQAAYTASKLALAGLSKTLAIELGPHGITSNCVVPGPILTGISKKYLAESPHLEAQMIGETTLQRFGQPSEVASLVLFLASDEAGFITGADVLIDGGLVSRAGPHVAP